MSGIFGVFHLDQQPLSLRVLEEMKATLSHRGKDGAALWEGESACFGHLRLWSTPESIGERLPLMSRSGGLVITADARIDNRDELIGLLGLPAADLQHLGDGELILAAYEKWGEACAARLLGDFAFAIWDERQRAIVCCRDHFGVKPFYYFTSERLFAFATEVKALFCLPQVSSRLNERMIAEHVSGAFDDTQITYYADIFRLPPAHSMVVSAGGVRRRPYWSLDPSRELRLGSDEEYAEAFRERFASAVGCRLRSAHPVGTLLSGGLDSSSITVMAERLMAERGGDRLHTFSAVFDHVSPCDERDYIAAVVDQSALIAHRIYGDSFGPLSDMDCMSWHEDKPVFGPNLFLHWQLFKAASRCGVPVMLDGFDGDSVVSHGFLYLNELASQRRWRALTRETVALYKNLSLSPWTPLASLFNRYLFRPMIANWRPLRLTRRVWRRARREVAAAPPPVAAPPAWHTFLHPDLTERLQLAQRYKAWRKRQPLTAQSEREGHYRTLTQPSMPLAFEIYDGMAGAFSIETRYPFWDRRLVEFCLSLPPEQKLRRGWGRLIMRRAMAGMLPAKVQWRAGKTDFLPVFLHGLFRLDRKGMERALHSDLTGFAPYLNIPALRTFYDQIKTNPSSVATGDLLAFWRTLSLMVWLQSTCSAYSQKKEVIHM